MEAVTEPRFRQVTAVGVGLLGGSLMRVLLEQGMAGEIVGAGSRPATLATALELGVIHRAAQSVEQGVEGSDLVVLACPVGTFISVTQRMASHLAEGAIVTDVGSVKGALVEQIEQCLPAEVAFVGGHPIAGSHEAGVKFSRPDLFQGQHCILTPTSRTPRDALTTVRRMWERSGALVSEMDPFQHDHLCAAISHLPHMVACALITAVSRMDGNEGQLLGYAGSGLKDTTRVAAGHPAMWRDICLYNREYILEALAGFRKAIEEFEKLIASGDVEKLEQALESAREERQRVG